MRAARAGCTTVEHGGLADGPALDAMAEAGVFYDPHTSLVIQNYLDNKERFLGVGNYTEEGFRQMEELLVGMRNVFALALQRPRLRIVFGTDALAGSHGRNWEELIYRVEVGGQAPMAAVVSATSLAAASLGLGDEIGTLAYHNVEKLFDACDSNRIHIVGAFPNPESDVLLLFANRYLIERDAQQQRQLKRIEPRLSALAQKIKQRQQEVSA